MPRHFLIKYRAPQLLLFVFFLTGVSALTYEILWQRMLILVLGASAIATTAILSAFFCGIAMGSWLGSKVISRFSNLFSFYALILLWIALWGINVPWLLQGIDVLQLRLISYLPAGEIAAFTYRFFMAILVMLPAAIGMGATIPVMNQILVRYFPNVGRSVSLAYGIDTLGAVIGCLLTCFVFIPQWGMKTTLILASALNGLAAVVISFSSRWLSAGLFFSSGNKEQTVASMEKIPNAHWFIFIYFLSGFLALGYEITWLRILGIFNTNSLITFSLALAVYLSGFSCGSLFLYPQMAKRFNRYTVFILSNLGVGLSVLCLIPVYYLLPQLGEVLLSTATMLRLVQKELLISIIMMLVPTLFMGLAYPAVNHLVVEHIKQTGSKSGAIYALGAFGAAIGVVIFGLFFVPYFDLVGSLALLCSSSLLLGIFTFCLAYSQGYRLKIVRSGHIYRSLSTGAVLTTLIAVGYGLNGPPFIRDSGQLIKKGNTWEYKKKKEKFALPIKTSILRYKAGISAAVSVTQEAVSNVVTKQLLIDGQSVASTALHSKIDGKLLGHLPILLHPDPKRVLTVGFGSGGTSWSMTRYGIDVEAVEIEPEVIRSAYLFAEQNHNVLNEEKFHLIINDARNYLHVTQNRYDVISTDVTNLQYKQNANLYTREYFELIKSKLTPDGIACAWVPLQWRNLRDFKILLKTFQDVFPHTSAWYPKSHYAIIIGTPDVLTIDDKRLMNMLNEIDIANDLKEIDFDDPVKLTSLLLLDEEGVRNFTGQVPLHTDDHPILEFFAIPNFYERKIRLDDWLPFSIQHPAEFTNNT